MVGIPQTLAAGVTRENCGFLECFRGGLDAEPVLLPWLQSPPRRSVNIDAVPDSDQCAGLHTLGELIRHQTVQVAVSGQQEAWNVWHIPKLADSGPCRYWPSLLCGNVAATGGFFPDAHIP